MTNEVKGGEVLIIGDLHLSDVFQGRHRSYLSTCMRVMKQISNLVVERSAKTVVFTGDIVGWGERNIRDREVLSVICKWFKSFKEKGVRVMSVRGNHDFGDYPDFQFLVDLGLIETSQSLGGYFDYYGASSQEVPEIRFHLVDYGTENRELQIRDTNVTTNIVIAHNNFTIQGVTNWYQEHDGIELARISNFAGTYMVISGHIHAPAPEIMTTDSMWGSQVSLFVLGCPTRPAFEKYTSCWAMSFHYVAEDKNTTYEAVPIELIPLEEEYNLDDSEVPDEFYFDEEDEDEEERKRNLQEVFSDIMSCRISNGNLEQQIMSIPSASDLAKSMAVSYLNKAILNL